MTAHSIADTKNKLSELVNRAMKGEDVVITRHGHAVARITGLAQPPEPKRLTKESIDRLIANRVDRTQPKDDAATLVRRIRDEEPE